MTDEKQFWRSFVPKFESGRKLTRRSCRESSSLSNCLCQYLYQCCPPARLFQILYITSTLHKTLVGPIKAVKIVLILMDSDTPSPSRGIWIWGWFENLSKKSRTFLDISETVHYFFVEKTESAFFVFCLYLCEKRFILKKLISKMISEKFSTNPENFNKFGRGRRIDLANSDGMTHRWFESKLDSISFHSNVHFRKFSCDWNRVKCHLSDSMNYEKQWMKESLSRRTNTDYHVRVIE